MYDYFSNKKFFKVLNAANFKNGYEYGTGINDVSNFIGLDEEPFKCFFTDIEHIFAYIYYGPCFREINTEYCPFIFEAGEKISDDYIPGWYSDIIYLGDLKLWTVDNIKWLIENGADISVENYQIVQWALMYNFQVFYFLQEYICSKSEELWGTIMENLQERGFL